MPSRSLLSRLPALALLALAGPAWSQATIVPADPVQFERISLRQTVDSCAFDPDVVQVSASNSDYFVDVAACCALESAPACASLAYSPLFERFGRGPTRPVRGCNRRG